MAAADVNRSEDLLPWLIVGQLLRRLRAERAKDAKKKRRMTKNGGKTMAGWRLRMHDLSSHLQTLGTTSEWQPKAE